MAESQYIEYGIDILILMGFLAYRLDGELNINRHGFMLFKPEESDCLVWKTSKQPLSYYMGFF